MGTIQAPNAKPRNGANKDCPQAFHALRAAANEKRANDPKRQKSGTMSGSVIGSGRIGPGAALKRQNPHDPSTTRSRRDSTRISTISRYSCSKHRTQATRGSVEPTQPEKHGTHPLATVFFTLRTSGRARLVPRSCSRGCFELLCCRLPGGARPSSTTVQVNFRRSEPRTLVRLSTEVGVSPSVLRGSGSVWMLIDNLHFVTSNSDQACCGTVRHARGGTP